MHEPHDNPTLPTPPVLRTEPPTHSVPAAAVAEDDNAGNDKAQALVQFLIAAIVLAAGVGLAWLLYAQKTEPATTNDLDARPVVETITAEVGDLPVTIRGFGTVRARDRVQIVPQVDGRILSTHPNFAEGGVISGGETVATLDPADADLAVARASAEIDRLTATLKRLDASRKRAESQVAAARTRLETQRAEAAVSRSQYEKLNPGKDVPPLVAREPQVREAEAALAAAEADLEDVGSEREQINAQLASARTSLRQAELNLERTEIVLPGDSTDRYRVLDKSADVGQYISPGVAIGTLYKVSTLEVPVPLPAKELQWFAVGEAAATITARDIDRSWDGIIVRTDGQIDPRSRLVNVVVAIDPDDLDGQLVPGLFVEATIVGEAVDNVAAIPRLALRQAERGDAGKQSTGRTGGFDAADGQRLYVVRDGVLRFVDVDVIRRTRELAYVRGLENGDPVVTTDLSVVTDGMKVEIPGAMTNEEVPNDEGNPKAE